MERGLGKREFVISAMNPLFPGRSKKSRIFVRNTDVERQKYD
jgi:hypothetical protein